MTDTKNNILNENQAIPEGWEVMELGKLVDPKRPISYGIVQTGELIEGGVPCIRVTDIIDGKIDNSNLITTTNKISNSYKRTILRKGDLVMALRGKIGQIAKIEDDLVGANLTRGVALIAVTESYDNDFLLQQISSERTINILERSLNGSALQELSIGIVIKIPVSLPKTITEQKAIAHILGLMDKAINTNNQLIAQKELRKKWLMQNLLTGKKRVKGFNGEWKEITLGDIGEIKTSSVDKVPVKSEAIVNLVNYMDVYRNRFITPEFLCSTTSVNDRELLTFNLKKGDILFTPSSETPDDIGHSAVVTKDLENTVYSYHLVRYRLFQEKSLDYDFRAYVFNNQNILNEFSRRATGSTRFTISKSDFEEIEASIPPTLEEQSTIARILQAADKEIQLLKEKTVKLKEQKKGMMQVLLTGKKRILNI